VVVVEMMVESDCQQQEQFFKIVFALFIQVLEEEDHYELKHAKRNKAFNGLNELLFLPQQIDDLSHHFRVGKFSGFCVGVSHLKLRKTQLELT
jgi:hypothetical protein